MKHINSELACENCEEKLLQAHPILASWFRDKVKPRHNDAHVSWTYRDQVSQNQAYAEGKSKLPFPKSAHNSTPSRAIDLFQLCSNGMAAWSFSYFKQINDEAEVDGLGLIWGGNFHSLGDHDHWELVKEVV